MLARQNKNSLAWKLALADRSNSGQICVPVVKNNDDRSHVDKDRSKDGQSRVSRCRDKTVATLARKGSAEKNRRASQ
jgi:hypothetical protein